MIGREIFWPASNMPDAGLNDVESSLSGTSPTMGAFSASFPIGRRFHPFQPIGPDTWQQGNLELRIPTGGRRNHWATTMQPSTSRI